MGQQWKRALPRFILSTKELSSPEGRKLSQLFLGKRESLFRDMGLVNKLERALPAFLLHKCCVSA